MQTKISYDDAIRILTSREKFHICLGLERITEILNLLGNPQEKLQIIHIAGTNGKGSVSKLLAEILKEAGYKTGLYTSPHILEYTERIQINGNKISRDDFGGLVFDICTLAEKNNIYLTEFEVLTAVMFKYFEQMKVDICVVETGLGGRLDATNAIKSNLLSVITSISLDHTERLGNTTEKIAAEKAGIIKAGCPIVVSGSNCGYKTIKDRAAELNAPVLVSDCADIEFLNGKNYAVINGKKYLFNLMGLWQKENLGLVCSAVDYLRKNGYLISENAFSAALKNVVWNCRFQYIPEKNTIIDGTHNPDGARVLRESLDFYFPDEKRIWIYGSMKNKDYGKVMKILFRPEDSIYLCGFSHTGSAGIDDLKALITQKCRQIEITSVDDLLSRRDSGSLCIISGSFYMIGEILNLNSDLKKCTRLDNSL